MVDLAARRAKAAEEALPVPRGVAREGAGCSTAPRTNSGQLKKVKPRDEAAIVASEAIRP